MAKVGVVTGYTGDFSVSKLLGNDNPKIARFESVPLIIKELENGGLDSVVSDSAVIANYVKTTRPKAWISSHCLTSPSKTTVLAARKGDEATIKNVERCAEKSTRKWRIRQNLRQILCSRRRKSRSSQIILV